MNWQGRKDLIWPVLEWALKLAASPTLVWKEITANAACTSRAFLSLLITAFHASSNYSSFFCVLQRRRDLLARRRLQRILRHRRRAAHERRGSSTMLHVSAKTLGWSMVASVQITRRYFKEDEIQRLVLHDGYIRRRYFSYTGRNRGTCPCVVYPPMGPSVRIRIVHSVVRWPRYSTFAEARQTIAVFCSTESPTVQSKPTGIKSGLCMMTAASFWKK